MRGDPSAPLLILLLQSPGSRNDATETSIQCGRYSTLFPRYKATLDQFANKDLALANSFRRRFEIWLTTSVLIHWQDTAADPTTIAGTGMEQEQIDDFRRDEMRRMAKAAVVYSQREVTQLGAAIPEGD